MSTEDQFPLYSLTDKDYSMAGKDTINTTILPPIQTERSTIKNILWNMDFNDEFPLYSFSDLGNSTDMENDVNITLPASVRAERSIIDSILWSMHLYLTPIIIVVGLSGNILSLIVFMRTRLRLLSSSVYLAALCIADSAFLIQLFVYWLVYVRVFIYHQNGWCQTFVYVMYVCSFLSVWFVVCFTVERYIVCIYPLKKQYICNVRRAKIIVVSFSVCAAILYSYATWTAGVEEANQCSIKSRYLWLNQIMGNVDSVITLVIPSVLIIFMNARIVARLAQSSNFRSKMISQQNSRQMTPLCAKTLNDNSAKKERKPRYFFTRTDSRGSSIIHRSQLKTTKMLVTISTIFLILNIPNHVIRMYSTLIVLFYKNNHTYLPRSLSYWQEGFLFLYYINFGINFFLYSLCGQNFRIAVKSLFIRNSRNNSFLSNSTQKTACHSPRANIRLLSKNVGLLDSS